DLRRRDGASHRAHPTRRPQPHYRSRMHERRRNRSRRKIRRVVMPVSTARKIAFEALIRVEAEGAYASDLLHAELGASVKPSDAALATELTLGVLRWRRLLDFLIERQLKKSLARLVPPVALALGSGGSPLACVCALSA